MSQGGNVERAAEWIFNNPDDTVAMELDGGTGTHETQPEVQLPDGSGSKYHFLKDEITHLEQTPLSILSFK